MSTLTVGQIARQNNVTADPQTANVPVVVHTASGKERQVVSAHFDGQNLVLTTSK